MRRPADGKRCTAPSMSRRGFVLLPLVGAATLSACSAGDGDAMPTGSGGRGGPRFVGGPVGGVYQVWAEQLSLQLARSRSLTASPVRSTAGSGENLDLVRSEPMTLALASIDSSEAAYRRRQAAEEPGLAALARVYDDYLHLLVRVDSPVLDLAELSGRRLVVGAAGSGTSLIAERLLACTGLQRVERVRVGLMPGLAELQAGRVDGLLWSGGIPTSAVRKAWGERGLRLLPLDLAGDRMRSAHGGIYRRAVIPAHTYANGSPVPTFAVANLLMGRADLADDVVAEVLRVAFARIPEIAARVPSFNAFDDLIAIETHPVPLHESARAYYRRSKP